MYWYKSNLIYTNDLSLNFIGIYYIIKLSYIGGRIWKLLKCNKGMKLVFRDNSNILDVYLFSDIILSLNLNINNIEDNAEFIYNSITRLDNVTIYIPKIYQK